MNDAGSLLGGTGIVSYQENGVASGCVVGEALEYGTGIGFIEVAGGLIGKKKPGTAKQGSGKGGALTFAGAQLAGQVGTAMG